MPILAPGLAKAYYDRILEIHFNRGSQGYEQKVVEYKDLMDKMMDNIQGVDRKTGSQLKGYDFVSSEVRSSKNHQGTVSPILWFGLNIIRSFRNEIVHRKIRIDYDDYRMCVKFLAKAIESFSQVPILNEIIDVYSTGNYLNPSQNAVPAPSSNDRRKKASNPKQKASPKPSGNKPRPAEAIPEGLQYQKTFKGVVITGYTGRETSLVIPSHIESKEVINIAPQAFKDNPILQRVSLPETLETIGESAFLQCGSLQQIDFPENLKTIGEFAFSRCTSLQQIDFPENLKTIGQMAFSDCNLHTVSLPQKLESCGDYPFGGNNLKFIYLSRGTKIGYLPPEKLIYLD
jgi:hypothetical protein